MLVPRLSLPVPVLPLLPPLREGMRSSVDAVASMPPMPLATPVARVDDEGADDDDDDDDAGADDDDEDVPCACDPEAAALLVAGPAVAVEGGTANADEASGLGREVTLKLRPLRPVSLRLDCVAGPLADSEA